MYGQAVVYAFLLFFRAGKITVPTNSSYNSSRHLDLAVNDQSNLSFLRICPKYSKTDHLGSGFDIVLGRTYKNICPMAAVMAYLTVKRDGEGLLFKFTDGWCLIKECFLRCIWEALAELGADYPGHSFQIGAATTVTVVEVCLENSTIRTLD